MTASAPPADTTADVSCPDCDHSRQGRPLPFSKRVMCASYWREDSFDNVVRCSCKNECHATELVADLYARPFLGYP